MVFVFKTFVKFCELSDILQRWKMRLNEVLNVLSKVTQIKCAQTSVMQVNVYNQFFGVREEFWFITAADFYGVNGPTNEFQATKVMSLNKELGKDVHSHTVWARPWLQHTMVNYRTALFQKHDIHCFAAFLWLFEYGNWTLAMSLSW